MPQIYPEEFKKKIVTLHEEEGRTCKSITAEYGVSKLPSASGVLSSANNAKKKSKPILQK